MDQQKAIGDLADDLKRQALEQSSAPKVKLPLEVVREKGF